MTTIPRFVYVVLALLAVLVLLENVWLAREKAETKRLEWEAVGE